MTTSASLPLTPRAWTRITLGLHALKLHAPDGPEIVLQLFDGGGHCASHAAWRVAGKVVAMVEAVQG